MRKTTLGEYGQKLPIGVMDGGTLNRDFTLRTYKSAIDRHLGNWDEANEGKYQLPATMLAARITKFMTLICESFGGAAIPLDTDGNSGAEHEARFYQYYLEDILYAYVYARMIMDHRLEISFTCSECKTTQRRMFDLRTLDVEVVEDGDSIEQWVKLKHPFKTRTGEQVRKVRVYPASWSAMTQPGVFSGSMSHRNYSALSSCISGIDCVEGDYRLTKKELDELSHVDGITIGRLAGITSSIGIDFRTNIECSKCKSIHTGMLDWTFDYFFGSSLPMLETVSS